MIYVKKLLANDIPTGKQFAIPSYIADPFFGVITENGDWEKEVTLNFINEDADHPEFNDLTAQVKLYPYPQRDESRFTVDINNLLRERLNAVAGDILVLIQGRSDTDFSFRLVRQTDTARYNTMSRLFSDAEKAKSRAGGHALLEVDDASTLYEQVTNDLFLKQYIELLKEKHNLVLTGAPGTGKTHLARAIAEAMNAEIQFVQFHPSYDYTDFVEGLRPVQKEDSSEHSADGVSFERKDGIFKRFCKAAILYSSQTIEEDNEEEPIGSFDYVFNTIKTDIINGKITEFSRSGSLSVDGDKRIVYHWKKSEKKIREDNVQLLYEHYLKEGRTSLDGVTGEDLEAVLKEITAQIREVPTRRIDKSEYRWTVDMLLRRKAEITRGSYSKNTKIPYKPFVFIIDEINRGELSKILGELFYAIDPGYRGDKGLVTTQYQELITDESDIFKRGFYVPENVYIIGTMNDIDRSVESMDFAVRRRFAWREITAEQSAVNMSLPADVRARMKRLNDTISKCELSSAYHIGGAYFLKLQGNDYEALWEFHIKGVIEEYYRGNPDGPKYVEMIHQALVEEL